MLLIAFFRAGSSPFADSLHLSHPFQTDPVKNPAFQIKTYLVLTVVFAAVDYVWLGVLGRGIYDRHLGFMLREDFKIVPAVSFYLFFLAGLQYFALLPALKIDSFRLALGNGAFFGFVTYMTYELTNYAVIDRWPLGIVWIDIAWGIALCSTVSAGGFFVARRFAR